MCGSIMEIEVIEYIYNNLMVLFCFEFHHSLWKLLFPIKYTVLKTSSRLLTMFYLLKIYHLKAFWLLPTLKFTIIALFFLLRHRLCIPYYSTNLKINVTYYYIDVLCIWKLIQGKVCLFFDLITLVSLWYKYIYIKLSLELIISRNSFII